VANAYSSISAEEMSLIVGMPVNEAVKGNTSYAFI